MKIGMMLSRGDVETPLADHFGKARWILVYEGPDRYELFRNEGLDGHSVARALAERKVTDVVVRHLGSGAYAHVTGAGMRVWQDEQGRSAREVAEALGRGDLRRLPAGEAGHAGHGVHPRAGRGERPDRGHGDA